jgi:diguanylate cyclase (GGDEF)-like protein
VTDQPDITVLHWQSTLLQTIDAGLVVLDRDYNVQIWNAFMENHSGFGYADVEGKSIFELIHDVPEAWLRRKLEAVMTLKSRAFSSWEQRPYLIRFDTYRPITGVADCMYQNVTFLPIMGLTGTVEQIGIIIYDMTDVAVSKQAFSRANDELAKLSRTDRLTGLANRGFWEECMIQEFKRAKRAGHPCSLIMFDIDHFKKVNDNYGHQCGDEVIRQTATHLGECMRSTDIAGRYGGEEYAVILIDTDCDGALFVAERIRETMEVLVVEHDGQDVCFTVSLGVAEVTDQMVTHDQLIEAADRALYDAKNAGRNNAKVAAGAGAHAAA